MPRCKLPDCPVAKDGRCLEGRGADCPNLIPEVDGQMVAADPQPQAAPVSGPTGATFLPLPGRVPLDTTEARSLARRGPCIVIALAGMPECGKTSLLARLHQLFQSGPVGGFYFAGSQSLPRFEELNWLSTIESGAATPSMERSSTQFDNSFVHLAVRPRDNGARVELLLNDITGETFEKAVASQRECDNLASLARADHLVVVIDGGALADPAFRHHHIEQARDFLQRVLQSEQCGRRTALHIVISKLDKLAKHAAVADKLQEEFEALFRSRVGSLNFWRIAARPMDGSLPTKERIAEMLAYWIGITHRYPAAILPALPRESWARDFCRYGN